MSEVSDKVLAFLKAIVVFQKLLKRILTFLQSFQWWKHTYGSWGVTSIQILTKLWKAIFGFEYYPRWLGCRNIWSSSETNLRYKFQDSLVPKKVLNPRVLYSWNMLWVLSSPENIHGFFKRFSWWKLTQRFLGSHGKICLKLDLLKNGPGFLGGNECKVWVSLKFHGFWNTMMETYLMLPSFW